MLLDMPVSIGICAGKNLNVRKEVSDMKKIVFLGAFVLIILVGLASYAAMTKEPISEGNLSDLKGKWEGWRTLRGRDLRTELEIYNDTLPLKGKFLFHDLQRKGKMSGTYTLEFNQGMIKNDNLYLKHGQDYFELSLHKGDGKMKLEGDFYSMGHEGTISLNKK
jgi:hypothetical protein